VDIGNQMAGQAGETEGAERVAAAYRDIDLRDIEIDEFEIPGRWRGSSTLATSGSHETTYERAHDVIALPGTPSGDTEGELVDVGYGTPEAFDAADVGGAVVMASSETPDDVDRWIHRMEKYVSAIEGGAVGFVFRNHIEGCLPPTGEVGYNNRPGPIPAVGVSKEVDATLGWHAENDLTASLSVDCRNDPAISRNISGELGPETDEVVLLTAHVDAHDIAPGANDNGAGTVLVVEIARLLKQIEDDLDTRIRCVVFGSEEIGLQGASYLAETIDLDTVTAVINIDGAGRNRTLSVGTNRFEALAEVFETVTDELAVPLETDTTVSPHDDQWAFVQEGVPGAMVSSTNPDKSGRGWGHTHAEDGERRPRRDDVPCQRRWCCWWPSDLGNYLSFQRDGDFELISPDLLDESHTAHATRQTYLDGTEQGYGYGWMTRPFLGDTLIEHGGSLGVSTAYVGYLDDADIGVALACNDAPEIHPQFVGPAVLATLRGEAPADATRFYALLVSAQ
jgi:aminopeptidase YwaD